MSDDREDARLYKLAADQGNAAAQYNLGLCYRRGQIGVAQDYKEAVRWYRLAANQGQALAQYNLGDLYAKGLGVAQDYVHAHMWLNLAAACLSGDEGIQATYARDHTSKRMTSEQISQAQVMARKCQESNFKHCD